MHKTNLRKFLGSILLSGVVAAVVNAAALPAPAQGPIRVLLDEQEIDFAGSPPVQLGGRVMVPLRGVFEAMNATVDYDARTRTIFAVRDDTQIQLRIGSQRATVNNQVRMLDVPAQVRFGRTLVPLRFVSEALGAEVRWSEFQRSVYITTPVDAQPGPDPFPTAVPTAVPTAQPPIDPEPEYPVGQRVTLTGVVTRITGNDSFEMRTGNNTIIDVQTERRLPATVNVGDRVEVTGDLIDNSMSDSTVRVAGAAPAATRATVQGTVTAVLSATRLTLRNPAGTTITVDSRAVLPADINTGDVVRVTGLLAGNFIDAERVVRLRAGNNTPDTGGQTVNFSGVVESVNGATKMAQIRGDNGQLYAVRFRGAATFARNDRVRVSGTYANGITTATRIERE